MTTLEIITIATATPSPTMGTTPTAYMDPGTPGATFFTSTPP